MDWKGRKGRSNRSQPTGRAFRWDTISPTEARRTRNSRTRRKAKEEEMVSEERWDGGERSLRQPLMDGQRTRRRDASPLREVVVDVDTTRPNEPSSTYPGYTHEPMFGEADATMRRLEARPSFSAADFGFEETPPEPTWTFWKKKEGNETHDPKKVPVAPLADRPVPDGPKFHYKLTRMMRLADEGKGKMKVVRYKEAKLLREGFLYLWQGTIFESKFLWQQVGFMFLVASIVAGFTWLVADRRHLSLETAQSLSTISETMSTILAFVLGLYLQKTVDIWWELRHGTLQKLMNIVDNMCMRMSIYFPGSGSNDVMARKTILRYGLLSIALLFKEAREIDAWTEEERESLGVDDLSDLVVDGMLTNSEKELLEDCGGKSQMVWVWISSLFTKWCLDGRLPDPLNNQETMLKYCEEARNAIGTILAQLNMQFPLSYTHTVVLMTKMMLFAVAVESGFSAGVAISIGKYEHLAPPITFLIVLPLIYQGLIDIKEHISNPFRDDSTDYCFKVSTDLDTCCVAFPVRVEVAG